MSKKDNKAFQFRGTYFFGVVLVSYISLVFLNIQSAQLALLKSGSILIKILPIFLAVILFTTLLNYFLKPKQIAAHLGHESGAKGWFWALTAGVISHGPMYAWYPLLEDLREHGIQDELIVVFFASRAIKIPLLPMMIDYFGLVFTCVLSFYMLAGALLQGWFIRIIQSKNRSSVQ